MHGQEEFDFLQVNAARKSHEQECLEKRHYMHEVNSSNHDNRAMRKWTDITESKRDSEFVTFVICSSGWEHFCFHMLYFNFYVQWHSIIVISKVIDMGYKKYLWYPNQIFIGLATRQEYRMRSIVVWIKCKAYEDACDITITN